MNEPRARAQSFCGPDFNAKVAKGANAGLGLGSRSRTKELESGYTLAVGVGELPVS